MFQRIRTRIAGGEDNIVEKDAVTGVWYVKKIPISYSIILKVLIISLITLIIMALSIVFLEVFKRKEINNYFLNTLLSLITLEFASTYLIPYIKDLEAYKLLLTNRKKKELIKEITERNELRNIAISLGNPDNLKLAKAFLELRQRVEVLERKSNIPVD